MKKILTVFLVCLAMVVQAKTTITDYQRIFLPVYTSEGDLLVALRVFKKNEEPSFLVVEPKTLETRVIPINYLWTRTAQQKQPGYFTQWNLASTLYYQLLHKNTAAPYPLENKGIVHAEKPVEGNILSIDLCPSSKPFERTLFNNLVHMADKRKEPVPISIAISGLWLIKHQDEFQWLLKQKKEKKLNITWVNHSFSHVFYMDLPNAENFLLSSNINLEVEILLTEKYLLEAGETPSVFFRFPGLISNKKLILHLKAYGLIPLGTDAWLAKNQAITDGGIILVHGNGNEPEGINKLLFSLKKLHLLDLKKTLE